jgi:2-hydroxyacyl-CoA lyase 1
MNIDGAGIVAKALKGQGAKHVFGICGIPVIELASYIQSEDIEYYGFRNEQAASYAAGAVGYMTSRPGICMSVSGPGMTNCISGLANAWSNKWPMILIGGAHDSNQDGMGGFQECDQLLSAQPYCKYYAKITSVERIPFYIAKAFRESIYGTPGPVYLDLPGDVLRAKVPMDDVVYFDYVEDIPKSFYLESGMGSLTKQLSDDSPIAQTFAVLKNAKNPLVIIGKGVAYADASEEIKFFIEKTGIPFLPTPMAKGTMPDDHAQFVGSARSLALKDADVIILACARLNWILHFGQLPRFRKDVKIIQIENDPKEIHQNLKSEVVLYGDAKCVLQQLNDYNIHKAKYAYSPTSEWWERLNKKVADNKEVSEQMYKDPTLPMSYYSALHAVQRQLPKDCIIVSEGSNTMDIGRTILENYLPKHRLDAGTFGTMGVGLGMAIAAQAVHPTKRVVLVIGDSAFGFSGMELETMARYKMAIIVVIINNNGIFTGIEELEKEDNALSIPVTALHPEAKYELMADAFGGVGSCAKTPEEVTDRMTEALKDDKLHLINVAIDPYGAKKPQEFVWLTKEEKPMKAKL